LSETLRRKFDENAHENATRARCPHVGCVHGVVTAHRGVMMRCLVCDGTGTVKRHDIGAELVATIARILETPREPDDQARHIVQVLVLTYDMRVR
jgi:hypothetical protein